MPLIQNYPDALLQRHSDWHMNAGDPAAGGRRAPAGYPGSGVEFLEFHRQYVEDFRKWYDAQPGADPQALAPWSAIPAELKTPTARWSATVAANERHVVTNTPPFASEDELGMFIEDRLHDRFLHGAAALVYKEPDLNDPMRSPLSTYFYRLHGLIENWRKNWKQLAPPQLIAAEPAAAGLSLAEMSQRLRAMEDQVALLKGAAPKNEGAA
ncbi:MAG: hypothetical protein ACR652_01965 [Methylocystis sp.]|uniref:hypothetical protein n=1 Tax=Methylocystis sp. TaxID=1911079 RepID=UPI003DA6929D